MVGCRHKEDRTMCLAFVKLLIHFHLLMNRMFSHGSRVIFQGGIDFVVVGRIVIPVFYGFSRMVEHILRNILFECIRVVCWWIR